jgi:hypothetical protein
VVEPVLHGLDRNEVAGDALSAVNDDDFDRREPEQAAGETIDLAVEAERGVDEGGGTKISAFGQSGLPIFLRASGERS